MKYGYAQRAQVQSQATLCSGCGTPLLIAEEKGRLCQRCSAWHERLCFVERLPRLRDERSNATELPQ